MMRKQPLVSIITGYYNRKDNLIESIQSVLKQNYTNFEYIIFDDCSTDGTLELLESFSDSRIKLLKHSSNMGFTKGIIHAISKAKGEYIAFHGAGDISFENRISKQVDLLINNSDIGIVGCLIEDVYQNESEIFSPYNENNDNFYFSHGEVMYRTSLYYRVGGYNSLFKYGQFTMLKSDILKISRGAFINEILYKRIHFSNGVTRNVTRKIEQTISYTLGKNISKKGLWNVDISSLVIYVSFQNIRSLKPKTEDEKRLLFHARSKGIHYVTLYFLFKLKLLPAFILEKLGSFLRRYKNI